MDTALARAALASGMPEPVTWSLNPSGTMPKSAAPSSAPTDWGSSPPAMTARLRSGICHCCIRHCQFRTGFPHWPNRLVASGLVSKTRSNQFRVTAFNWPKPVSSTGARTTITDVGHTGCYRNDLGSPSTRSSRSQDLAFGEKAFLRHGSLALGHCCRKPLATEPTQIQ